MFYILQDNVYLRILEGEYLAYSALTNETIILDETAFYLLESLKNEKCCFSSLLSLFSSDKASRGDTKNLLKFFLEDFIKRGFVRVYC